MDPATALAQEAQWCARSVESYAKPESASEARIRAMGYKPRLDHTRYQCPHCWVASAVRSPLCSVCGTDDYDLLGCRKCGLEFIIPF